MLTQSGGNQYSNDPNGKTLSGGGRVNVWHGQNRLYKTTFNDGSNTFRCRFTYGPDGLRRLAKINPAALGAAAAMTTHITEIAAYLAATEIL